MSFYQMMQLGPATLKPRIKESIDKKEKRKYIAALVLKSVLCLIFCISFVSIFSAIFGEDNSIVGVVSVILLLTFRFSNLDFDVKETVFAILGIYAIYAICPYLASISNPYLALMINFISILILIIISCHNTQLSNQSTIVLSYLLLYGYKVNSKEVYINRIFALILGGLIVASIFYFKQRKKKFENRFLDILKDIDIRDPRTRWQIKISIIISTGILIGELLHLERTMWIGFACMSIMQPQKDKVIGRMIERPIYSILGCVVFTVIYFAIPKESVAVIGMLGGIMVGFSATYRWQVVFNTFGALSAAVTIFGLNNAILLRIIANIFGALYIWFITNGYGLIKNIFEKFLVIDPNDTL